MGNPKKRSRFICLKHCGINYVGEGIQRINQREKGHIKPLTCIVCQEITKNLEVRYCDDYLEMLDMAAELHKEYYGTDRRVVV